MKIFVTTARGMTEYLAREIRQFGIEIERTEPLGVSITGSMEDVMRLNYRLRTAHRVLISLNTFPAQNADQLYRKVYEIPWADYLHSDRSFSIHAVVRNDTIRDTRYATLKCKDAVVDRMRREIGRRPDTDNSFESAVIFLRWLGNKAEIFLDSSGTSLHRRGYRLQRGTAPMQETLAAGLLIASEWNPEEVLVNPMCGSGTIAIEGAMMAAGISPGHSRRNWGFMHLKGYDPDVFQQIINEANREIEEPKAAIIAGDIKTSMIRKSQKNARRAGVADWIRFEKTDFRQTKILDGPGLVIFNPEYGERMGEEKQLTRLYSEIGNFLKQKCQGKTAAIFTTNTRLQKSVGLRTKRKIPFFTGPLEGRLLLYDLYAGSKNSSKQENKK